MASRSVDKRVARQRKLLAVVISQCLATSWAGIASAGAPNITVDAGVVADADDGMCSIVEAIHNVNAGTQRYPSVGECNAGSAGSNVILPGGSTFTLSAVAEDDRGLPVITSSITIDGNGSRIERATGAPAFGILKVGGSGTLTLDSTTLADGSAAAGGGIFNESGVVRLTYSMITGNTAATVGGGIHNYRGSVYSQGSTLSNNAAGQQGGGLSSYIGTVESDRDRWLNNTAGGDGGGIDADGASLTLGRATIASNTSSNDGGGISARNAANITMSEGSISRNSASLGGGILNRTSTVALVDVVVATNVASRDGGGFYNADGSFSVTEGAIRDNRADSGGAGAHYGAALIIRDADVSGNAASPGFAGGIAVGEGDTPGTIDIADSLFSRNSAVLLAGALDVADDVSGIIRNTTFSGNAAGTDGGAIHVEGVTSLELAHLTLANNAAGQLGEGLVVDSDAGSVSIRNTVITALDDAPTQGCEITDGALAQNLNNLVEDGSCAAGAVGQITGNAGLEPLDFNGGNASHAPLPGSNLIDAADAATCEAQDQRSVTRTAATCDIGAIELTAPIMVDEVVAGAGALAIDANDGLCSLPEAMNNSSDNNQFSANLGECETGIEGAADRIILPANATFELTAPDPDNADNGLPVVEARTTIEGNGARITRVGVDGFRLIQSYGELNLSDLTLSNGSTTSNGGALYSDDLLRLSDVTLVSNTAGDYGGALYLGSDSSTTIVSSSIVDNTSSTSGAVDNSGELFVANSTLSANVTDGSGGALYTLNGSTTTVVNSTFALNVVEAGNSGSAIYGSAEAVINLSNTLVVDGSSSDSSDCFFDGDNTLTTNVNNLIEDGTCAPTFMGSGQQLIDDLNDNGGPTETHDLVYAGNPAIDGGDAAACADLMFDQRGAPFARSVDGNGSGGAVCDIGAIEFADELNPGAAINADDVLAAGGAEYTFTITYTDDSEIDLDTIALSNIVVVSGAGALSEVSVANNVISEGEVVTTYTVTPPGGTWDAFDNDTYTVTLLAGEVADVSGKFVASQSTSFEVNVPPTPEIDVLGNGLSISDGDATPDALDDTDFGDVVNGESFTRTFTIQNEGSANLNLTGAMPVTITGDNFAVASQPALLIVPPGQGTTFEITLSASGVESYAGTVMIASDDADEAVYDFAISGQGVVDSDLIFADGFE